MPLKPEAQQSEYLKALCRMLRQSNPENIYQNSDAFYQLIYKPLWMHLEKQAGSHTELDIGVLFDITLDKFLRQLRDQRPKNAMLIWERAPNLFPPPKRGDGYTSDVKDWANATFDWTTREMRCCETGNFCEQAISKLNKEMYPLKSQGDDLLAWLNCDANKIGTLPDTEGSDGEEDVDDESAPGANNKAEKSRRRELAKLAKAIAKLINSQGAAVADREISMEHSAHFVVDMDEIIRALPIVQLPLELYLKKIGTNTVIDMIRKLKSQGEFISLDDEDEDEGGNSHVHGHENLQTQPMDDEPTTHPRHYSEVEFTQFLKQWGAFIEKSKELASDQRYENDADWQEGAELFRQTWQRLEKAPVEEEAPLSRLEQIKACIIAPLQQAQAVFESALMDYQNYEAVDDKSVRKLAKLKKALEDARKDLNNKLTDHDLNSRVLETMLEGFKASEDESAGGRLNKKGYTPEQIAEKLGLKNRDEVRASQEQIALLLVSIAPNQLRNKLINTQWEYLTGIKEQMGDAMPDLPKRFDSDKWIIVLRWLLPMLERQKEVASFQQRQSKEKLRLLEERLNDRCRFNQPALFIEGDLEKLLQKCTDDSAEQISKRYQVALDTVQSIFAQRLSVLDTISEAQSDWRKAHKRLTKLKEALNIFENTRGTDE